MNTEPLLSYGMYSFPSPMQVNFNNACLNIVISPKNSENQVWCKKIVFSLPVGLSSNDLTNDPGSIAVSVSSNLWQVCSIASGKQVTMSPIHGAPQLIPKEGINIQFSQINSNSANGSCELTITEYTASSDLPDRSFSPKEKKITLNKFPEDFWIGNFVSNKVNVLSGQSVTLSWNMSGVGHIEIIIPTPSGEQRSIPIEEGKTSWESGPLEQTTAFELQASAGGSSDLQIFSLQTVVNVSNQELVLDTLTVNKGTQLNQLTRASTINAQNTVTAENLSATSNTNTENLSVRNSANIQSALVSNLTFFNIKSGTPSSVSILDSYYPILSEKLDTSTHRHKMKSDGFYFAQGCVENEESIDISTLHITISKLPTLNEDLEFKMILNSKLRDATFACFPAPKGSIVESKQFNPSETRYFQTWIVNMGTG
ncbi:MAG: hypothetical protein MI784_12570 [Cytophagales bacterium]|nr:hypothetical protein [Cytophagales bacterium]